MIENKIALTVVPLQLEIKCGGLPWRRKTVCTANGKGSHERQADDCLPCRATVKAAQSDCSGRGFRGQRHSFRPARRRAATHRTFSSAEQRWCSYSYFARLADMIAIREVGAAQAGTMPVEYSSKYDRVCTLISLRWPRNDVACEML